MRASYLIRFDDLCPTMNWAAWNAIEEVLVTEGLKPILAVVPDNKDPKLHYEAANPRFWDRVRQWQSRGWTVGLHGYQHIYVSRKAGTIGLNGRSEFAGLPFEEQERKLKRAVEIFRGEGVESQIWVAPAHSFDEETIEILSSLSVRLVSDGFSLFPHLDSHGTIWIPQQLWRFRPLPIGVWTVCFHHNPWSQRNLDAFRKHVQDYGPAITSIHEAVASYGRRQRGWYDTFFASAYLWALRGRRGLRHRSPGEEL